MSERELQLLIERLMKQIDDCFTEVTQQRIQIQELDEKIQRTYATKEYIENMQEDIQRLEEKLDEIGKKIMSKQEEKFRQTIALQGAILLAVLAAALGYIVPLILQNVIHH
jgi:hypothetical protein